MQDVETLWADLATPSASWHASVFEVDLDERPDWIPVDERATASKLRRQLEEAVTAKRQPTQP